MRQQRNMLQNLKFIERNKLVIQKMTGTTKVYLTWEQKKYRSKKKVITKKQIEKRNRKKQKTRIYK